MQTFMMKPLKLALALLLFIGLFGAGVSQARAAALPPTPCTSAGTVVTCNLFARAGSFTPPGGVATPVWGYTDSAGVITGPGGPVLIVNQGDTVTVNLTNALSESTSLLFQGQEMIPDTTGAAAGGTKAYTFTAANPGTFLYEAGLALNTQHQVAMGLYGVLVVRPGGSTTQAYANPDSAFNEESLVVLSEFDTALAAAPATFDMRNYNPQYFLINGKAYPAADAITVTPGNRVLLRYVNAGLQAHAMTTLGLTQTIVAQDGSAYLLPHQMVSETIATGQTLDTIVTIPAAALAGTQYPLYDANMLLHNSNTAGIGGMLTFLTVAGTTTSGSGGPVTTNVAFTPASTNGASAVTLSATIAPSSGASLTAAEYFMDAVGADGTGCAITGSLSSVSVTIPTSGATTPCVNLASLTSSNHTVYVHGRDNSGTGTWGSFASAVLNLDRVGPVSSAVTLSVNPDNGTADVAVTANTSDSASGNNIITAAEYFIDPAGAPAGGTGTAMVVNIPSPIASLSATIPAATVNALSQGNHTVSVRSMDAVGNWGAFASITLVVDKTGPVTSSVTAQPNPTNGVVPFNTSVQAVRVFASFADGNSNVTGAEGFLDTVGATGSGFVFIATDGNFNSHSETGYADIPLAALSPLANGNHTISVHSKDAAGNWGAFGTVTLVLDRTAPTLTSITLTPNLILEGAASVALTVNGASDGVGGTGLNGGEYWINPPTATAPAAGSGTQFSGTSASIPTISLAVGSYTVSARIHDVAGNWSGIYTAALTVAPNAIFADGFESGVLPGAWTSRSTTSATRLSVTAGAALVGTRGLSAQGNNTNYVQYNFGTAANPATGTFDARFYFRPNGNTSTGKDIFAAATNSAFGTVAFRVRYRLNGTTPQVQIQVGATANATWTNILGGTSNNYIEVVWQASGNLVLYVNGVSSQTLAASASTIGSFRLGSVTNTGNSTAMFFDAFSAKRSLTPLVGP
jgi:hypothetical protein